MKSKAAVWTGVLALAAATAWAQPQPPDEGGPEGPPGVGEQYGRPPGPPPLPGPPGRPGGRGGPRPERLTEAQETEVLNFINENEPKMYEQLSTAKQRDPAAFHHKMSEIWGMYKDPDIRGQFVKTIKAQHAVHELVDQYKRADAADKAALKEKLTEAVGVLFDVDVAGKEVQIKKMQEQIAQLKDKIAKRRQLKDKYVSTRVEQLTGEGEDWAW